MERRSSMELSLTNMELMALKAALHADISDLIREIARTDHRDMREGLKVNEELLESILEKLNAAGRKAA
ncbi:MAG: hypothetical protein HY896_13160 [Deltaproteobacteria bacterium]|nr:hypothetical protein [Deltaproteobacteria bacterium]